MLSVSNRQEYVMKGNVMKMLPFTVTAYMVTYVTLATRVLAAPTTFIPSQLLNK